MATLNDLAKRVRNTRHRLSTFFLQVHTGSAYEFVNMGRVMNGSFTSEPVTSSADQDGRESSQLFNITVSFAMMQTSNEELSLLDELAMPTDTTNFPNGHRIYVSGSKLLTSQLNSSLTGSGDPDYTVLGDDSSDPNDVDGMYFKNVLLKPSPDIDLAGEESSIGLEFNGRLETDALNGFDDNANEDANHIVVSPE
jgi:hypothetical protein